MITSLTQTSTMAQALGVSQSLDGPRTLLPRRSSRTRFAKQGLFVQVVEGGPKRDTSKDAWLVTAGRQALSMAVAVVFIVR
jgi:hypothetical protein